jgi:Protein of unknown function (DUF2752)
MIALTGQRRKTRRMEDGLESERIEGDYTAPYMEARKSRRLAALVVAGLTCILVASVVYTASEVNADGQYFTICGFKVLTGLPCPGCGLTHSFCAIGRGDLRSAFYFNAVGPPLYLISILVWLRFLFVLTRVGQPVALFDRVFNHVKLVRSFAIAIGAFGLARIIYLLIWKPAVVVNSPLAHLIERIMN